MDQEGKLPPAQRVRYVANSDKRVIRRQSNLPTGNKKSFAKNKNFCYNIYRKLRKRLRGLQTSFRVIHLKQQVSVSQPDTTVPKTGKNFGYKRNRDPWKRFKTFYFQIYQYLGRL